MEAPVKTLKGLPYPIEPFSLTRSEHRFEITLIKVLYLISVVSGAYYIYELPGEDRWAGAISVGVLLLSLAAIFVLYNKFKTEKKRTLRAAGIDPYAQEEKNHGKKAVGFKT